MICIHKCSMKKIKMQRSHQVDIAIKRQNCNRMPCQWAYCLHGVMGLLLKNKKHFKKEYLLQWQRA